ncbi:MAG: hypothetical protein IKR63_04070 [Alloprevotella sp.]|nr:hypothetical protein [Alloprevotella sp.]
MDKNRLAVLVTSCDAYQDIWDPFFTLMNRYWADISYNVYLNTEHLEYSKNFDNFIVKSLNNTSSKKLTWSERMLSVLDRIEEEYVFILVEDFFLRENVQTDLIEKLLEMMDEDKNICQFQLFGTRINCDKGVSNVMSSSIQMDKIERGKAKVVFVPTIWRKSILKKWLRPHESIWAFESQASKRAYRWNYKETVYRVYSPAIFNYLWEKDCYCVVNGKWMLHPLLTKLFEENDIQVDYNVRGTITMDEWREVTLLTIMKRKGLIGTIKSLINRVRSIF